MSLHNQFPLFERILYPQNFVFFNTSISCMLYLEDTLGRYHTLSFRFGNYIPNIILHYLLVFFHHCFYPFFLLYNFFMACRFLIYKITHQGYIIGKSLRLLSFPCGALGAPYLSASRIISLIQEVFLFLDISIMGGS